MRALIKNLSNNKLSQRILKLGIVYVSLEIIVAIVAVIFVAKEVV